MIHLAIRTKGIFLSLGGKVLAIARPTTLQTKISVLGTTDGRELQSESTLTKTDTKIPGTSVRPHLDDVRGHMGALGLTPRLE